MSGTVLNSNNWVCPKLGKSLDKLNWLSGGALYDVEAKTRFQRCHFILMKVNTFLMILELFYFTFLVPFNLLKFITTGIQLSFLCVILFLVPWSPKQRSNVVTILNWMAIFPERDYPIKTQDIKIAMEKANKYSMLCDTLVKLLACTCALILAIGVPAYRCLKLNEGLTLTVDAHLPFLPPSNVVFYFFNFVHQCYVIGFLTILCIVTDIFGFSSFVHMIYFLKSIRILTENMSEEITTVGFDKWHESIITSVIDIKRFVV